MLLTLLTFEKGDKTPKIIVYMPITCVEVNSLFKELNFRREVKSQIVSNVVQLQKEIIMQDYIEELLDESFEEYEDDIWSEDYSDV